MPVKCNLLGVSVVVSDFSNLVCHEMLNQGRREGRVITCVAINPEKILCARSDPAIRNYLESADIHICDGVGAVLALRLLYGIRVVRVTGVDFFLRMVSVAEEHGSSVFLLGGAPEVNEAARRELSKMHPDLKIAGGLDGYFDDNTNVIEQINDSGAEILFVGMGSPRQEDWISRHRADLRVSFCMGVGGTFDVVSGSVRRAPVMFRRTGTEFLYRLACQPRRWRRQLKLPVFASLVAWDAAKCRLPKWT